MAKKFKERVLVIRNGEWLVGRPVNISGVVAQAKTEEELLREIKIIAELWMEALRETFEQEEPFDVRYMNSSDEFHYDPQELKLRQELQRYRDIYGELPKQ